MGSGDKAGAAGGAPGKYIPLHMREGAARREAEGGDAFQRREGSALRVSNLSPDVKDSDLHDLFKPCVVIGFVFVFGLI
jgi:hypothetical protein